MRCPRAQRWISQRLDGVLDRSREVLLEEHLAECGACRAYAEALTGLDLELLEAPEPTPDFTARVVRRLAETPVRRWSVLSRPALFRPIAAGLGIAAVLGGFLVGSFLQLVNGVETTASNDPVEVAVGETIYPLAEGSVESVLIAMLSDTEE